MQEPIRNNQNTLQAREIHLRAWRESRLTQKEYCARHQISPATFSYWKKKEKEEKQVKNEQGGFVRFRLGREEELCAPSERRAFTVVINETIQIHIHHDRFSAAALRKVVAAVGGELIG
jgi:hypothetical protein